MSQAFGLCGIHAAGSERWRIADFAGATRRSGPYSPHQWGLTLLALLCAWTGAARADEGLYDPLALAEGWRPKTLDLTVNDAVRDRKIPVRIYLPAVTKAAPLVLFSHGLGGSRDGNPYLGRHWSGRGYVVVFLQHVGSDESVWKGVAPRERMAAMREAANLANTLLRFKDVAVVLDQLERWNALDASPLSGRLDLTRVGMSGHSYGAVTTQGVSGQGTRRGESPYRDERIKAAVIMSPSSPRNGGDPGTIFGSVTIPWLLMTGTRDVARVGNATVASRLAVYQALPAGGKYQLVLDGAEHEAFGDRETSAGVRRRNPNHHRAILAVSTAFWDAYLREDGDARVWLDGEGPRGILEEKDRWDKK